MGHRSTATEWEQKCSILAAELTAGRDLAKQLQLILDFVPASSSSSISHQHYSTSWSPAAAGEVSDRATREALVRKILASYENALSMLNMSRRQDDDQPNPNPVLGSGHDDGIGVVVMMKSSSSPPGTRSGSPGSEDSDRDSGHDQFKDATSSSPSSRKRKSVPRWSHQVRVSPGMGLEGPLDDGFSWRKYGQKDILGAKYPRGYYRCTLRNVQGCLATKQVQRSDEDSTIFEITYRGRHTCTQSQSQSPPSPSPSLSSTPAPNTTSPPPPPPEPAMQPPPPAEDRHQDQLLLSFRRGLNVITDGSEFGYSPPATTTAAAIAATTFAGSLFFPPPPPNTVMMTSLAPQTSSTTTCSTIYHQGFSGDGISYGREQISAPAPPATTVGLVDFPFGNMDHLFDDDPMTTTFTFDNSGFFS